MRTGKFSFLDVAPMREFIINVPGPFFFVAGSCLTLASDEAYQMLFDD